MVLLLALFFLSKNEPTALPTRLCTLEHKAVTASDSTAEAAASFPGLQSRSRIIGIYGLLLFAASPFMHQKRFDMTLTQEASCGNRGVRQPRTSLLYTKTSIVRRWDNRSLAGFQPTLSVSS